MIRRYIKIRRINFINEEIINKMLKRLNINNK